METGEYSQKALVLVHPSADYDACGVCRSSIASLASRFDPKNSITLVSPVPNPFLGRLPVDPYVVHGVKVSSHLGEISAHNLDPLRSARDITIAGGFFEHCLLTAVCSIDRALGQGFEARYIHLPFDSVFTDVRIWGPDVVGYYGLSFHDSKAKEWIERGDLFSKKRPTVTLNELFEGAMDPRSARAITVSRLEDALCGNWKPNYSFRDEFTFELRAPVRFPVAGSNEPRLRLVK